MVVKRPGFAKLKLSPTRDAIELVMQPQAIKAAYLTYFGIGDKGIRGRVLDHLGGFVPVVTFDGTRCSLAAALLIPDRSVTTSVHHLSFSPSSEAGFWTAPPRNRVAGRPVTSTIASKQRTS
jgi:hypothetical protein